MRGVVIGLAAVLVLCLFFNSSTGTLNATSRRQEPSQPGRSETSIRVQSSLVLVDVITKDPKNGLPVKDLRREDFRVLDDGHEVPIASFDAGPHDARPVLLWLVVICNEGGIKIGGSAEFGANVTLFRPALDHLEENDLVGLANWCDNGQTRFDLLPTQDRDAPLRVLAEAIKPIAFQASSDSNAIGEDAFRRLVRMIIQDAHRRNPQPLPVILYLDGDHTGQPRDALDHVVDDFLETSGVVFGIRDSLAPFVPTLRNGEISEIEHYMADQTGGEFFTAAASRCAETLDQILIQLHYRYQLSFVPASIDGKRHRIKVDLTKEAREKYKKVRLRYRPEYIPLKEEPAWVR